MGRLPYSTLADDSTPISKQDVKAKAVFMGLPPSSLSKSEYQGYREYGVQLGQSNI